MDYVAEVARLEKLLLEAFDKQSKLESRIEELTVDHEQFHILNDENDRLGIENEELKQRVAEIQDYIKRMTDIGVQTEKDRDKAMGERELTKSEMRERIAELECCMAELRGTIRLNKHVCPVCWTQSYEPIETREECDLTHPHDGEHMRCLCCEQSLQLHKQQQRIAELEAALAKAKEQTVLTGTAGLSGL